MALGPLAEELVATQRAIFEDTLAELAELAPPGAAPVAVAAPGFPEPFLELTARALTYEANEAAPGWETRVAILRHYHLELLQRRRVEVLSGLAPLAAPEPLALARHYLCTPLDPTRLPTLTAAVDAFFSLLRAASVDPVALFDAPDAAALLTGRWGCPPPSSGETPSAKSVPCPPRRQGGEGGGERSERGGSDLTGRTFAEVFSCCFYGRYAAPLHTNDQDLLALERERLAAGLDPLAALDRRLAGPLLHELTHLHPGRRPLDPPYLDECIAAALGARAMPAIVVPDYQDHNAMVGAGWFTQVGEHLIRAFGLVPIIRAHAGLVPWSEVLPPGLVAIFATLGWEQYLATRHVAMLGEAQQPEPFIKAIWLAHADLLDDLVDELLFAPTEPDTAGPPTLASPLAQASRPPAADTPTLTRLLRLPWSQIPTPAPDPAADVAFFAAAAQALAASPRLTPEGSWRVLREPLPAQRDELLRAFTLPPDATRLPFRWVYGPLTPPELLAPAA